MSAGINHIRDTVADPAILLKHIFDKLAVMMWTQGRCTCIGSIGGIVLARPRTFSSVKAEIKKNPNHTSLNENYVVPCICLRAI